MTQAASWTGPIGAWVEIVDESDDGLDYGWPPEALRFAYLGSSLAGELSWEELVFEWAQGDGGSGEGIQGEWARAYLTADDLKHFLEVAFGVDAPQTIALAARIDPGRKYIVSTGEEPVETPMGASEG